MKAATNLLCLAVLLTFGSFYAALGQNQLLKQANELYERFEYANAIELYLQVLKKDKNNAAALEKIAECYRNTSNYGKAEGAYKKAIKYNPDKPILQFRYAQSLMANQKYADAGQIFEKYTELVPYDSRGWQFAASCRNISKLMLDSGQYTVKLLSVNSKESDFSPAFYNDGIVFASSRSLSVFERKDGWTGEAYLDMYYASLQNGEWTEPIVLPGKTNTPAHEGPATFNKFGNLMYFTRSATKGEAKKSGTVNLKLYQAKWVNSKWTDVDELPFNSDSYSVGQPALSPDGKTLYFTSDMPGGFGGKDLYLSEFVNGKWGMPKNLGRSINTEGDEMFPTIQSDGTLYFSSDGLGGLGGLDIFVAVNQNGAWIVDNAASPINSSMDDFGLILTPNKQLGYFSSNRTGSRGDDLYQVDIATKKAEQILSTQSNTQAAEVSKNEQVNKVNLEQTQLPNSNSHVYMEDKNTKLPDDPANNNSAPWMSGNSIPDSTALQNASLVMSGRVVDIKSNDNLPGLTVELKDLLSNDTQRSIADYDGRFHFSLEPEKNYHVRIVNGVGLPDESKDVSTANRNPNEFIQVLLKTQGSNIQPEQIPPIEKEVSGNGNNSSRIYNKTPSEQTPGDGTTTYEDKANEPPTEPLTAPVPAMGLTFKVQVGSFEKKPPKGSSYSNKFPYDITTEYYIPKGYTRYVSRTFYSLADAEKYRAEMLQKGFTGAFIAAYENGIRNESPVEKVLEKYTK